MSLASRRGTSLAELVVALAMLGVVAAVLLRMLVGNLRFYQSQTQIIDRAQNLRSAAALLTTELRELSATDGDLYAATPSRVSLRAMRRLGFVCAEPNAGATHLTIRESLQFGSRDFDPGSDSLLVYAAGRWLVTPLTAIRPGACADGAPAALLETSGALDDSVREGAPVRGFEPVSYRLYRAGDGEWQIGLEARGDVIQPVVGPVTAAGLEFVYRDAAGAPVTNLRAIAAIEIRLRMPTAQIVRGPDGVLGRSVDSLVTVVALRNNRRSPSPRLRRGGQGREAGARRQDAKLHRALNERGVALVIAVFVLTVIGALVVAAFFVAVQEHRMSDAMRRHHRAMAAAESKLAEVLRQWPDDGGSLQLYPHDSLVLQRGSVVLRRLGADLYLAAVPEQALGMLIFRAGPCETARADGVEMTQAKCYIDSTLQKMAVPTALGSRSLVHLF